MSSLFVFDLSAVEDLLDGLANVRLRDEDWEKIGQATVARILERTEQGRDQEGKPFAPYSPGYAKRRVEAGRKVAVVTLAYTGRMLGALSSVAIMDGARLTFVTREADRLATIHQNGVRRSGAPAPGSRDNRGRFVTTATAYKIPPRPFLGVGTDTKEGRALANLAGKLIAKRINEAARAVGGGA